MGGAVLQRLLKFRVDGQARNARIGHQVSVHIHAVVAIGLPLVHAVELGTIGLDQGDIAGPDTRSVARHQVRRARGRDPVAADESRAQGQYASAWGEAETQAYYEALQSRLNVQITGARAAAPSGADTSR